MSMLCLKDYQQEAVDSAINKAADDEKRVLIVMPTGSGKTVVMVEIAQKLDKKTLILAHRDELVQQAYDRFKQFWPTVDIGICKADRNDINHQIVVGSLQTCSQSHRLEQLKQQNFDVLFIDECHHSPAASYQRIINELGFTKEHNKILIGLTATPERNDQKSLGSIFDSVAYQISISELIEQKMMPAVIGRKILTGIRIKKIKSRNGDFITRQLSCSVNTAERNEFIVRKYTQHAFTRQAIAFCVDVKHAKDLAEEFNKHNIKAAAVWGAMPAQERQQALSDFKNRIITVLTSCSLLTEGYDESSVNAVLMCRPTKSKSLYVQCVGRGLRPHPGKEDCLVLDFMDEYHTLTSDVLSLNNVMPEAKIIQEKAQPNKKELKQAAVEITTQKETDCGFDLLKYEPRYLWVQIDNQEWSLMDDYGEEIVFTSSRDKFVGIVYNKDNTIKEVISEPLPFYTCLELCERYAQHNMSITFADTQGNLIQRYSQLSPTDNQKCVLRKHNRYKNAMTRLDAYLAIRAIKSLKRKNERIYGQEPITTMQKIVLDKAGIDTINMSKKKAMLMIAQLKKREQSNHVQKAQ